MGDLVRVCGADPIPVQTRPGEPPVRPSPTERAFAVTLAEVLGVEDVPVDAHVFDDLGADSMTMAKFCARVRKRGDLPAVSIKDVYQHPSVAALAGAVAPAPVPAAGAAPVETALAGVLAGVLGVGDVPVDAHVFDDLGADSMTLAKFCARVRKRGDLPAVSIRDVYARPTIRALAAPVEHVTSPGSAEGTGPAEPAAGSGTGRPTAGTKPPSTTLYAVCGALQLAIFFGYTYLSALVIAWGLEWLTTAPGVVDVYLRSVAFGGALFAALSLFPIVAKWLLVGRWKPGQEIPVWSLAYVRFWLVKTLVRANPLGFFFVGTPVFALYLRALGAHIGRGVAIFTKHVPVCTDLFTVGDRTVIRKDAFLTCYQAHTGVVHTGSVTLGRDVLVGEKTVLDIDTVMGDGAQLGHTSSLHRGMSVPTGERWHGSPAQPTTVDYRRAGSASCGTLRRVTFSIGLFAKLLFLYVPLTEGGAYMVMSLFPSMDKLLDPGIGALTSPRFYLEATAASAVVFFGAVVVGLLWICTAPRLLHLFLQPDRDYPLYGWRYALHRSINRMTNVKFFMWLLGDSSYIVPYLQVLGYDLSRVEQTGSNFGTEVAHETPFMSSVGSGTMVADGLSMINAEFSDTAFRISRASIGARSFLGNNIAYPSGAKVGDNCLLATKTMVPLDGPVREGVGLLGSPPFEIPRSVARDTRLIQRRTPERLSAKNRFNLRSMALFMGIRWLHVAVLTLLGLAAVDVYDDFGHVFLALYLTLSVLLTAAFFVLVERAFTAFRPLQPRYCSIYDPYFWWHERLWKVPDKYLTAFDGTPFKNLVWRALGVRLGKRVFDDGVFITERTLAAIGDDATLNAQVKIQCHSQEDGAFKSDHIRIGARCTLGVAAFVHYGVRLGDGAVLEPDSFLMKGTEVPPGARWGGNPAEEIDAPAQVPPAEGIDRRDAEEAVIPTPVIPPPRASGRHRNDAAGPRTLLPASRPGGRHRVGPGVEVPAVMTTETR